NLKPVAYVSRKLTPAEINYSTIERELLGIVWGVTQFRHFLFGRRFQLKTDHKPLQWLKNHSSPTSRLTRWALVLQEYDFEIQHCPGKTNSVADALSRIILINMEWTAQQLEQEQQNDP